MPKRTDIKSILIIGAGPIVIGQALRVRLLRRTGLQGAARRGLPRHPGELQSGHHHDRPGDGRRHLHRADHLADGGEDHRERTSGRAAADHGRADRAELRARSRPRRRAGEVRRGNDRRQRARPSTRPRTANCSRRPWSKIGLDVPRVRDRAQHGRGAAGAGDDRFPGHHSAVLHHGRLAAAASPTTRKNSSTSASAGWKPRRPASC